MEVLDALSGTIITTQTTDNITSTVQIIQTTELLKPGEEYCLQLTGSSTSGDSLVDSGGRIVLAEQCFTYRPKDEFIPRFEIISGNINFSDRTFDIQLDNIDGFGNDVTTYEYEGYMTEGSRPITNISISLLKSRLIQIPLPEETIEEIRLSTTPKEYTVHLTLRPESGDTKKQAEQTRNFVLSGATTQGFPRNITDQLQNSLIPISISILAAISLLFFVYAIGRTKKGLTSSSTQATLLEGERQPIDRTMKRQSDRSSLASLNTPSSTVAAHTVALIATQPTMARPLHVFLCHSSSDKLLVRELYQRLLAEGVQPWLDEENLLPGHDWQHEIPRAVQKADVVLVCLSRASVTKSGYIQQEIKYALDAADQQPEGTIFIIPVKLEPCDIPERLNRWQWVNLYTEQGLNKLIRALRARATQLGLVAIDDE